MLNVYPCLKFRRSMPEKLPLFRDYANSRLPLKNHPFLRESGYERGIHFDRECVYVCVCVCVCGGGGRGGGGGGGGGPGPSLLAEVNYA